MKFIIIIILIQIQTLFSMIFYIYLLYLVSYFLHLSSRFSILGAIRFDLVLAGVLFILLFFSSPRDENSKKLEPQRILEILCIYVVISLPFVAWPGSVLNVGAQPWIKAILFFYFTVKAVSTKEQLKILVWVFVGCQVFRVLEPTYLHLTVGYWGSGAVSSVGGYHYLNRLSGAPHDVVNPTQLSWVAVNIAPFLYYLCWDSNWIGKICFTCIVPPVFYGFILTGARGGVICLLVVVLGIVWLSEHKIRNGIVFIVLGAGLIIFLAGNLSQDLSTRYLSLVESDVAGSDTVQGRFRAIDRYLSTLSYKPIQGNGLGTSREVNWNIYGESSQITHNLYLEIAQELGFIGLFIFLLYIRSIYRMILKSKQVLRQKNLQNSWHFRMIKSVQVWFFMDIVYSMSVFGLRSWEWYLFGGFAAISYKISEKEL